jgi:ribosomal protein S18 acetylase RimI-like enzyme
MAFNVDRASPWDIDAVMRVLGESYEYHGYAFPPAGAPASIEELLAEDGMGGIWLLRDRELVVGLLVMTFGYDIEFGGRLAVLTDLYVLEKHRRKGTGTAALRFAEQFCRRHGICALELQVERSNGAAQAFYRKAGFEVHDRVPMTRRLAARGD